MPAYMRNGNLYIAHERSKKDPGDVSIVPGKTSDIIQNYDGEIVVVASNNYGYTYHYELLHKNNSTGIRCDYYQFTKRRAGTGEIVARSQPIEDGDKSRMLCGFHTVYQGGTRPNDGRDFFTRYNIYDGYTTFNGSLYVFIKEYLGIDGIIDQSEMKRFDYSSTVYKDDLSLGHHFMYVDSDFFYYLNRNLEIVILRLSDLSFVEIKSISSIVRNVDSEGFSLTNRFVSYTSFMNVYGNDLIFSQQEQTSSWGSTGSRNYVFGSQKEKYDDFCQRMGFTNDTNAFDFGKTDFSGRLVSGAKATKQFVSYFGPYWLWGNKILKIEVATDGNNPVISDGFYGETMTWNQFVSYILNVSGVSYYSVGSFAYPLPVLYNGHYYYVPRQTNTEYLWDIVKQIYGFEIEPSYVTFVYRYEFSSTKNVSLSLKSYKTPISLINYNEQPRVIFRNDLYLEVSDNKETFSIPRERIVNLRQWQLPGNKTDQSVECWYWLDYDSNVIKNEFFLLLEGNLDNFNQSRVSFVYRTLAASSLDIIGVYDRNLERLCVNHGVLDEEVYVNSGNYPTYNVLNNRLSRAMFVCVRENLLYWIGHFAPYTGGVVDGARIGYVYNGSQNEVFYEEKAPYNGSFWYLQNTSWELDYNPLVQSYPVQYGYDMFCYRKFDKKWNYRTRDHIAEDYWIDVFTKYYDDYGWMGSAQLPREVLSMRFHGFCDFKSIKALERIINREIYWDRGVRYRNRYPNNRLDPKSVDYGYKDDIQESDFPRTTVAPYSIMEPSRFLHHANELQEVDGIGVPCQIGGYFYIIHKEDNISDFAPRILTEKFWYKLQNSCAVWGLRSNLSTSYYRNKLTLLTGYDISQLQSRDTMLLMSNVSLFANSVSNEFVSNVLMDDFSITKAYTLGRMWITGSGIYGYTNDKTLPIQNLRFKDNFVYLIGSVISNYMRYAEPHYTTSIAERYNESFDVQSNLIAITMVDSLTYEHTSEDIAIFNDKEFPRLDSRHFNTFAMIRHRLGQNFLPVRKSTNDPTDILSSKIPSIILESGRDWDHTFELMLANKYLIVLYQSGGDWVLASKLQNVPEYTPQIAYDQYGPTDLYLDFVFKGFFGNQYLSHGDQHIRYFVDSIEGNFLTVACYDDVSNCADYLDNYYPTHILPKGSLTIGGVAYQYEVVPNQNVNNALRTNFTTTKKSFVLKLSSTIGSRQVNSVVQTSFSSYNDAQAWIDGTTWPYQQDDEIWNKENAAIVWIPPTLYRVYLTKTIPDPITQIQTGQQVIFDGQKIITPGINGQFTNIIKLPSFSGFQGFGLNASNLGFNARENGFPSCVIPINRPSMTVGDGSDKPEGYECFIKKYEPETLSVKYEDGIQRMAESEDIFDKIVSAKFYNVDDTIVCIGCDTLSGNLDPDIDGTSNLQLFISTDGEKFTWLGPIVTGVAIQRVGITDIRGRLYITYFKDDLLHIASLMISEQTFVLEEVATVSQDKYTATVTYK